MNAENLTNELDQQEFARPEKLISFKLKGTSGMKYSLERPEGTRFFVGLEFPDSAIIGTQERIDINEVLNAEYTLVEASLSTADKFIRTGRLEDLKKYYESWKSIEDQEDPTPQRLAEHVYPASDGWGNEHVWEPEPDYLEYLVFPSSEQIKSSLMEKTMQNWISRKLGEFQAAANPEFFTEDYHATVTVGQDVIYGRGNKIWTEQQELTQEQFEGTVREFLGL